MAELLKFINIVNFKGFQNHLLSTYKNAELRRNCDIYKY